MPRFNCSVMGLAILLLGLAFAGRNQAPGEQAVPIVDITNRCLLGGAAGGMWVKPEVMAKQLKGGEKYGLYSLTGFISNGAGSEPLSAGPPCAETYVVKIGPAPQGKKVAVAVGGQLSALPRTVTVLSSSSAMYRQVVSDDLKAHGITAKAAPLNQVLKADLDGDGLDEVLLSASRYAGGLGPNSKAGDYSIVLLRKIINGKVETIPIVSEYHRAKGNFDAPSQYLIGSVLDLNRDGKMEIIIYGKYYEGEWAAVYSLDGNKIKEVLKCGCGS